MRKQNLIVSEQHWKNTFNLRVPDVNYALRVRPERLYQPIKHEECEVLVTTTELVPANENTFQSIDDALAAVRKWCG